MKNELVVIDFDDTLNTNGTEIYFDFYQRVAEAVGSELADEEIISRITAKWGAAHPVIIASLLHDRPQKRRAGEKIYEELLESEYAERVLPVPGCAATLGRLASNGYVLALATAAEPSSLRSALQKFKVPENIFSEIITAYDLPEERAKPEPYQLNLIMKRQNKTPHQTRMVGDSASDVLMAHHAGVVPIVVRTGHLTRDEAVKHFEVDERNIIHDITHIEPVLGRLSLNGADVVYQS